MSQEALTKELQTREPQPSRYAAPAVALHWLTALLIAVAFLLIGALGLFDLEDYESTLVFVHKSVGLCVLLLTLPRMLNKIAGKAGGSSVELTPMLRKVAAASHGMIYLLMVAAPLAGWLKVSAAGKSISLFGIPVPALLAKNRDLADTFGEAHEILAYMLLGLIVLHVGAALSHKLFHKDAVLYSMLPFERFKP